MRDCELWRSKDAPAVRHSSPKSSGGGYTGREDVFESRFAVLCASMGCCGLRGVSVGASTHSFGMGVEWGDRGRAAGSDFCGRPPDGLRGALGAYLFMGFARKGRKGVLTLGGYNGV